MTKARALPVSLIAIAFLFCAQYGIRSTFAPDDTMNLANHLKRGLLQTLIDNLMFWNGSYRPTGGVFYLANYSLFRLEPLPYRITGLLVHAANCFMTYVLCRRLSFSPFSSLMATLVVIGHANMCDVYFNNSAMYDVLAYFFSLAALLLWLAQRSWTSIAALGCFLFALGSKEIAVSLPIILVFSELLWPSRRDLRILRIGLIVAAVIIACGYAWGKTHGADALANLSNYRLEFTWQRYVSNNLGHWNEYFYTTSLDRPIYLGLIALSTALVAYLARTKAAAFAFACVWILPLPISFIPGRGGSSLLLPLLGVGLMAAVVAEWVRWRPVMVLLVIALCANHVWEWRNRPPMFYNNYVKTWSVIRQLRDFKPYPPRGAKVLFEDDPFSDWDMFFIAQIVWNDPVADVYLSKKLPKPLSAEEVDGFHQVFRFDGERLSRVRCKGCDPAPRSQGGTIGGPLTTGL